MNWLEKKLLIAWINRKRKQIEKGGGIMVKPGIYSTEFWITLISGIVVAVCNAFKVDPQVQDAIVKLVIAYITSRTVVKASSVVKNGKD